MDFQLFFSMMDCQMVKITKMGGKMMLTKVLGIKMIRKQMTTIDMSMNGVYALTPSLISVLFRRIINETRMATNNHAISIIRLVAISIKL